MDGFGSQSMSEMVFTESEASAIKRLLDERLSADRAQQKAIRAKIRALGFFISDYWPRFSSRDFDELVRIGKITIMGGGGGRQNMVSPAAGLKPTVQKLANAERKSDIAHIEEPCSGIQSARNKYRPDNIKFLLIAESPPNSVDRFFYYADVKRADWLFLGIMGALYPEAEEAYMKQGRPQELKQSLLRKFQSDGFYLLDMLDIPIARYSGKLEDAVPALIKKIEEVASREIPIILIKASVYDAAAQVLTRDGFKVVAVRIPFPGQGWQPQFKAEFVRALAYAGVQLRTGLT